MKISYFKFINAVKHAGLLITALLLVLQIALPVQAKLFKKKEKPPEIENFEPPTEDAYVAQCDPIRQKIVKLSKTPRIFEIFIVPRREYLIAKHRRCKAKIMDQQFKYLKHVDIKNPTLDPLPQQSDETTPQPEQK